MLLISRYIAYNEQQIEWFKAGSALNMIRAQFAVNKTWIWGLRDAIDYIAWFRIKNNSNKD
jgi:hypothetical protein